MRYYAAAFAALTLLPASSLLALTDRDLDPQALTMLQGKAEHASLRDQCYLYAELVHTMTEIASRQLAAGEAIDAARTLATVERYAGLLDSGLANDTKKVKDAEILMRQTEVRLKGAMNAAALEDRPVVQHTIQQLDGVESKLMAQVFAH
ncbi:MAG TPA: hypothetical protein VGD62_06585 [Acidobacteriaceae bacterium]